MSFLDAIERLFPSPTQTRYYKVIANGFLVMWGTGDGGTEITEEEYITIAETFASKPTPPDGYDYRLKADLTWEQYEFPFTPDPEEEPPDSDEELLTLLIGGEDNG